MNALPPRWVRKFLAWFLDERLLESSLGDLEEKFGLNIRRMPRWRATIIYIFEGLGFIKLTSKSRGDQLPAFAQMIHAIVFFGRLVKRDKAYYLVSMFGLGLSMTSFVFIAMFIFDELSFDKIHLKRDRIYRVTTHLRLNDMDFDMSTSQFPAAQALKNEFPEIEETVRLFKTDQLIEVGTHRFMDRVVMADQSFFKVFSFPLVRGDANSVLKETSDVVVSETGAQKYFGTLDAVGKEIKISGRSLRVSAVMKDIPGQSHIHFDVLLPLEYQLAIWRSETGIEGRENKWYWIGSFTYVLLHEGATVEGLDAKLPAFVNKYFPERFRGGRYELQPLGDIHLTSHNDSEFEPNGHILYVRLFTAVAIAIVVVSAISLINLSYFRIGRRMKEVGIRRFLGQRSNRVISQLSFEAVLTSIISFTFSILLCVILLPRFNLVVDKHFSLIDHNSLVLLGGAFAGIVLITLFAVWRPTARLVMVPSNKLLKGAGGDVKSGEGFRNILVGLQVCFSFVLLVFSFVVIDQLRYFERKDLGFEKSNIISIPVTADIHFGPFKKELLAQSSVVEVTGGQAPGTGYNGWRFVPEGSSRDKPLMLPLVFAEKDFLRTMKIDLLEGENFRDDIQYDTLAPLLVTRRATIELGWMDDAVGRTMEVFGPGTTEIMMTGRIVGVVEDFHSESLHDPVKPVVFAWSDYFPEVIVRVTSVNGETIQALENTWKKFSSQPFRYTVLEEKLNALYSNERQLSDVVFFFTIVVLYLTCYGLYAMSSLLFRDKLKEIAIRKVFGAGKISIMKGLYAKYLLFNTLALVTGVPIAFWVASMWLESFQYRVDIDPGLFVGAGLLTLLAGMLSVSYYLARVTFTNPLPFLKRD